jgi:hypothetical protein
MKAEIKLITPEFAQKILTEKNLKNRALSRYHVEFLAKEMREGNWKVNGDTICLNGSLLIDGQHRLAAVVMSGVTIQSWVIEGMPSDVFDTKDIGKRRSAGDTLSVQGHKNATRLAAALILTDRYMTGRADVSVAYSNTEVQMLFQKYPDISEYILTFFKGAQILPLSVVDTCNYLFSKKDTALAQEFIEKVVKGTGLEQGTPWYLLRERLMKNTLSKAKLSRPYLFALCIKAWNHTRKGELPRFLRWRDEGSAAEIFPLIK